MFTKRKIDHIVYAVPNLEEAMDWCEEQFGIRPLFGGYHTNKGTKNAVLNLGNACYLEILAADEENTQVPSPRWMGIDLIDKPQITRWALKSSNLQRDSLIVNKYNSVMGVIDGGQRKQSNGNLLAWQMIMPLATPRVEIIPFMTDWQNSKTHPTDSMPEHCALVSLEFTHPNPPLVTPYTDKLHLELNLVKGETISIKATINTPNGIVQL